MSDEWHTPLDLAADLKDAVDGFDLDPASGCEPEPIAAERYTKADDGLVQPWFGKVFLNPPYSREIADWMERAHRKAESDHGPELIVALIPARVDTDWWHNHVAPAELLCLIDHRLQFGGAGHDARFPCVIAVYGENVPEDLKDVLTEYGGLYTALDAPLIREAYVGTEVEIRLDDHGYGFPAGVDAEATAVVQAGRINDRGALELLTVQPESGPDDHETYYLLEIPDDPTDIRCYVEHVDMIGWRHVPLEGAEAIAPDHGPDPVGYIA